MNKVDKTYQISSTLDKVWDALVNPETIEQWGAGPDVEMSAAEGAEFRLWGGDIFGKNIVVKDRKLLTQEWYGSTEWEAPSNVEFHLSEEDGLVSVRLIHTNFPGVTTQEEFEGFASGWDDYYMGAIKKFLEN